MAQYVFKRYEKKYFLTKEQYETVLPIIEQHMKLDQYGKHTICNLYFDTNDYRLIRASMEKPVYKEKLRLRSYGIPTKDTTVFLELKKKYQGIVYKRRVAMTLEQAYTYFKSRERSSDSSQIFNEIDYFMNYYGHIEPKVYIAYDRMAYFCPDDENFRLTFDFAVRGRDKDVKLEDGDAGEVLIPDGSCIMEVKVADAFPRWMIDIFNDYKIYPASFSKYGTYYVRNSERLLNLKDTQVSKVKFVQPVKTTLRQGEVLC